MTDNHYILSICIPTYNRAEKVLPLVRQIVEAEPTVQVVVVDNQSEEIHVDLLEQLTHPNFKLVKREKNIGGNANVADAYSYSDGKYSLLCLDKDYINVAYLGRFLDFLMANPNLAYGQCSLNQTQAGESKFYTPGFNSLMAWAYDCRHPSGFFVCNETLRQTGIVDRILNDNNNFAFNIDLLKAHMIMVGLGCYVNFPLISSETPSEASKQRSFTYSGDNIWFLPKNIITRNQLFIADAITLGLPKKELKQLISRLYSINQSWVSSCFSEVLRNEPICAHYGILPRKVKWSETLHNLMTFKRSFLSLDLPISKVEKYEVIYFNLFKLIARILLRR